VHSSVIDQMSVSLGDHPCRRITLKTKWSPSVLEGFINITERSPRPLNYQLVAAAFVHIPHS
jgi:hypothetical protein